MSGQRTLRAADSKVAAPPAPADAIETLVAQAEAHVREVYPRRVGQERYSCFNAAHLYAMQEVERALLAALRRHGFSELDRQRILDIGCGTAVWLRQFVKWGALPEHLTGVDLLEDRIAQARRLSPREMRLVAGNAASLTFDDAAFDVVLQSLVLTSVTDTRVRGRVAAEMLRVVRPGGIILWYDYHVNNPRNADVRAVTASELARLFQGCEVERTRVTLAPPLARAIAPRSKALYALLSAIPLLKTHYLAVIRRPL